MDCDNADPNGRQPDETIPAISESGMTTTTIQGDPDNGSSDTLSHHEDRGDASRGDVSKELIQAGIESLRPTVKWENRRGEKHSYRGAGSPTYFEHINNSQCQLVCRTRNCKQ